MITFTFPIEKNQEEQEVYFFDYLQNNLENDFEFIRNTGKYFRDFVQTTFNEFKNEKWSEEEKNIQLIKRSRYAEFNLLHDRGY